jgi:hypothetical protein
MMRHAQIPRTMELPRGYYYYSSMMVGLSSSLTYRWGLHAELTEKRLLMLDRILSGQILG